jgi:hypothetical protein
VELQTFSVIQTPAMSLGDRKALQPVEDMLQMFCLICQQKKHDNGSLGLLKHI